MLLISMLIAITSFQSFTLWAGVWPSGGMMSTPLRPGVTVSIQWDNALRAEHIDVALWDGERRQYTTILKNTPSSLGRAAWTIPASVVPGSFYRFVIRDSEHESRADFSLGFHQIAAASDFATTVEDESRAIDSLIVTPFPAGERARIAWTNRDVASIDIIDVQGVTALHIVPAVHTRACSVNTSVLQSGRYTVSVQYDNGILRRTSLVVSH